VNGVTGAEIFWWVAVPYFALGVFVIGHIWRWRYDQYGWTSRSTQLQEQRMLKWGGPIFHYATFAAIGGHVLGILVPAEFTNFIGIPDHVYHRFAAIAGTVAAVLVILGVVILAGRRLLVPRVRATTSPVDWLALVLLLVIIITGIIPTTCSAAPTTTAPR
jgi:nitrate reductase gamma subunit